MVKRRILSFVLAAMLFTSSVCTGYAAENEVENESGQEEMTLNLDGFQEIETKVTQVEKSGLTEELMLEEIESEEPECFDEEELVPVIIMFDSDSIIESDADAVMNLVNELKITFLEAKQESVIKKIEKKVLEGKELDIHYQYTWLVNGIATELPYGMIEKIEAVSGVEKVVIQTVYETCTEPGTANNTINNGIDVMQTKGYDGKGTKIAIIDTGIDLYHQSFAELDESKLTQESATKDSVGEVLEHLNAYSRYEAKYREKIALEEIYRSSKIPYGFNYVDTELRLDHTDNGDDHGTHVAGIAAANDIAGGEMCGAAPAAQLYVMKVFGRRGGSYTEDLLAAIEDALMLDADVINMSLGSRAGFSSDGEYMDEIYGKVSETGTILVISAGNDGTSGDGTNWSTGLSLSSDPDNGTVGSPGTYVNALTVANADCTADETSIYFSSSWGPTPDLKLEPDIAAPGTEIYSTTNNGTYGIKSGTSMSAPYIAGAAAIMMRQMEENGSELSPDERFTLVNTLLMSTAEPVKYEEIYWSPRSQGAGLVNLEKVLETKNYLLVPGMNVPKVELGDDPEKTGSYEYKFVVKNGGNASAYYDVETCVQTEFAKEMNGHRFMSKIPVALDAEVKMESDGLMKTFDYTGDEITCTEDARYLYLQLRQQEIEKNEEAFRYDLDENNEINTEDVQRYLDALTEKADVDLEEQTLKVDSGESVNVSVAIDVSEEGKAYMDANFENGIYVEGFTLLNDQNETGVNLSLPYMGFYGDWTSAPILDDGYYWEDPETSGANYTFNEIYTRKDYYSNWKLGINPYLEEEFDEKYISLSPNSDGSADSVSGIQLSLLRNVKELAVTFTDENGKVYHQEIDEKIHKAAFDKYYEYYLAYDMTDENGEYFANNSKIIMNIELKLDYEQSEPEVWSVPITIDTESPQMIQVDGEPDITVLSNGAKQYIRMKCNDNVGIAAVCLLDEKEHVFTKYASDHKAEENEEYQYFDITGIGDKFYVVLGDYAFNTNTYQVETTDNAYIVSADTLYGYRISDEKSSVGEYYGWVDINKQNAGLKTLGTDYMSNLSAAEYIDGYVVGIDSNNNLVAFEFNKWNERKQISWINGEITDMAYDPVTQSIYAYNATTYSTVKINPITGETTRLSNEFVESIVAMTCSDTGVLYAITRGGELKTIDKETGMLSEGVLVNTGLEPSRQQSMTYDVEQNCIYWASYEYQWNYETSKGRLIKIDLANDYEITDLGTIGGNAQIVGLIMLNERGAGLFDNVEISAAEFDQSEFELLKDESKTAKISIVPWCAQADGLEWVSADSTIAEVTQDGVITGKAAGETKIQIQKDGQVLGECNVRVIELKAELYGFAVSNDAALNNKWVKMNAQTMNTAAVYGEEEQHFVSAECVNDILYAYDEAGNLYKMNTTDGSKKEVLGSSSTYQIRDMAYDYKNGIMYGIAQQEDAVTTDLVQINLETGEISIIKEDAHDEQYYSPIYAIGITTDGTICLLSEMGNICMYNAKYNAVMQMDSLGSSFPKNTVMSITMTYDHENGGFYIVPCSYRSGLSLWYYEHISGKIINLGPIRNLTEWNGLYILPRETTN